MIDNVNHPKHYEGSTSLECIDVMEIAFGKEAMRSFCKCNAFKYMWRHKYKGGEEDLRKAEWYLKRYKYSYSNPLDLTEDKQFGIIDDMLRSLLTDVHPN